MEPATPTPPAPLSAPLGDTATRRSRVARAGPSATSATAIHVTPLGAGRDVGRSCIVVRFTPPPPAPSSSSSRRPPSDAGVCVMLDCGLHMGREDAASRYPDFERATPRGAAGVDAVVVTHTHSDHCGALPVLTARTAFAGRVLASHPTKALLVRVLEDLVVGEPPHALTKAEVESCVARIEGVEPRETVEVRSPTCARPVRVTCFKAGHAFGAVMVHLSMGDASLLYSGDFNATPDRRLGAYDPWPFPGPSARRGPASAAGAARAPHIPAPPPPPGGRGAGGAGGAPPPGRIR